MSARDFVDRGTIYIQHGKMDQEISDYTKAIDLNPKLYRGI